MYRSSPGYGIRCTISDLDFDSLELQNHQEERNVDEPDCNYEVSCFGDVPVSRKPVTSNKKSWSFEISHFEV